MGRRRRVLVVEDEPAMREVLRMRIEPWGFDVAAAATGGEARAACDAQPPDVVICDVVLPDGSGLDLLPDLRGAHGHRPVVMITAHGTIDAAVEALKRGAADFLTKPLDYPKLHAVLDEVLAEVDQRGSLQKLQRELEGAPGLGPLVGTSKPMRDLFRMIEVLGGNEASTLITGESGTGKELVARAIHDLSARASGPFVAVNAAAIPEGLMESELFGNEKGAFTGAVAARAGCFELANGGTLFLDEIAEMPLALQPKILRAIECGRVRRLGAARESVFDARLVAATNKEPEEALKEGRLRPDLYYRLNVFTLALPPLRDRIEDLPLLAQHFVGQFNRKHSTAVSGLRPAARDLLEGYDWPGNVRELRNVMERAVILARQGWIEPSHLPPYLRRPGGTQSLLLRAGLTMAEAERLLVAEALKASGNNKAEAARRLGIDVKTLRSKLKADGGETGE
jgi:DNA-binding NtrC family response regulator